MSKELNNLTAFMNQLAHTGMSHENIVARGYDYALTLYRSKEELQLPRGTDISSTLHVQLMDHAADLLREVVERSIAQQEPQPKQAEPESPYMVRGE